MSMGTSDGPVVILSQTVVIDNTETKALPTTSIVIVPAPQTAGKALRYRSGTITTNWVTADKYTNIDESGNIAFYYGNAESNASARGIIGTLTTLFGSEQPVTHEFPPYGEIQPVTFNPLPTVNEVEFYAGKEIRLVMFNAGSGNLTGGNAANKLIVTVEYSEINVTV